jgi:hypothetical protein
MFVHDETGPEASEPTAGAGTPVVGWHRARTPSRQSDSYPGPDVGVRTVWEIGLVERATGERVGIPALDALTTVDANAWVGIPWTSTTTTRATARTTPPSGPRFTPPPWTVRRASRYLGRKEAYTRISGPRRRRREPEGPLKFDGA